MKIKICLKNNRGVGFCLGCNPKHMSHDIQHKLYSQVGREESSAEAQTASAVVMVRPAEFRLNFDTAADNAYQEKPENILVEEFEALAKSREEAFEKYPNLKERVQAHDGQTHAGAIREFDEMVELLRRKAIEVIVVPGVLEHSSADEVFPNNPLSLHAEDGGTAVKYPMAKVSRRREKELPIVDKLVEEYGYKVAKVLDLSGLEDKGNFVEGTGSMVLDRENKIAYASLSQRTTPGGVAAFAKAMGYTPISFRSVDKLHRASGPDRRPADVYHANVVMSVGDKFAVICAGAIENELERMRVSNSLLLTGKEVIEITTEQMNGFAGNILQVRDREGNPRIVMSETAYRSFTVEQLESLSKYGEIVPAPIPTIEKNGGGSARCMILEVHLPRQEATRLV